MIRLAFVAFSLLAAAPALAVPMTWRVVGTGAGTLDGAAFDGRFAFILKGDAATYAAIPGLDEIAVISPLDGAAIRIAGHGRAAFAKTMRLGYNSGAGSVFVTPYAEPGDVLDFYVGTPVDLTRPLAPIAGEIFGLPWIETVPTSRGELYFESSSDVTFSAVPLPAAAPLLLAALGAAGLLAGRSRPRRVA